MKKKITSLFEKIDNKKWDFWKEYNKIKSKLDLKKNKLKKEYLDLLNRYNKKKENFLNEYSKFKEKYEFKLEWRKIIWNKNRLIELKKNKKSAWDSLFSATIREILSIPFIWMMLIPAFILDICLFIYQNTAIRLYKIPLAKRSDYIVFDRWQLAYLNWIQKINCIYCSYFNWLMQYAVEVAWRTEKYWCPIKHIAKKRWTHNWEKYFAEYWDPEEFKKVFWSINEYSKKEENIN